jgi:hypothetical protein
MDCAAARSANEAARKANLQTVALKYQSLADFEDRPKKGKSRSANEPAKSYGASP